MQKTVGKEDKREKNCRENFPVKKFKVNIDIDFRKINDKKVVKRKNESIFLYCTI